MVIHGIPNSQKLEYARNAKALIGIRRGDAMPKGIFPRISTLERLLQKISITENGCWEWQASLARGNYGVIGHKRRTVYAHRFSYEHYKGRVPDGLQIDHLCKNPKCVNPEHLEAVTPSENTRRSDAPRIAAERHLAITHCPKGHPYDLINTRYYKGKRFCKECNRLSKQRRNTKRELGE